MAGIKVEFSRIRSAAILTNGYGNLVLHSSEWFYVEESVNVEPGQVDWLSGVYNPSLFYPHSTL